MLQYQEGKPIAERVTKEQIILNHLIGEEQQEGLLAGAEVKQLDRLSNDELISHTKSLPNGKAPDIDLIPNEVLNFIVKFDPDYIRKLFNKFLKNNSFPKPWKIGRLILIDKPNKPPGQLQSCSLITASNDRKTVRKASHEQTETPGRGRTTKSKPIRISVWIFDNPSYRIGPEANEEVQEEQALWSGSSSGHTRTVRQHQAPPHL